jgi:hypothetical protein
MSTNCVVRFVDDGETICAFYKHYDGNTFGEKLTAFYSDKKMVEGFGIDSTNQMNGMSDLAAQTIANFETQPGDLYMTATDDEGDYTYEVYVVNNKIAVSQV